MDLGSGRTWKRELVVGGGPSLQCPGGANSLLQTVGKKIGCARTLGLYSELELLVKVSLSTNASSQQFFVKSLEIGGK